jgi:Nucleoside-diphosphate-sugar epimerases
LRSPDRIERKTLTVVVTGGAGFIGSHLVEQLMRRGERVRVVDNLTNGKLENLALHAGDPDFEFLRGDLKDPQLAFRALQDAEIVFHMAANPEVRISYTDPEVHFKENVVVTFNLLEAARRSSIKKFVFASSSTVYGDVSVIPTPESYEMKPISVYGASKASSENLVCSYSHLYGFRSASLRYANIIGPRSRHGVIYDFLKKLSLDRTKLEILGDGTQRKSYLYIEDAVRATLMVEESLSSPYDVFNVGNEDWITVREIAQVVAEVASLNPTFVFSGGTEDGRGWKGDVKFMLLDSRKLKGLGWSPTLSSAEAVRLTAKSLLTEVMGSSQS